MKITKDTILADLTKMHPNAEEILKKRGMYCVGCETAKTENLEHAAVIHGYELDELIEGLNKEFGNGCVL